MPACKTCLQSLISYMGYFSVTEPTWGHFDQAALLPGQPFALSCNLITFASQKKHISKIQRKVYWDSNFPPTWTPRTTIVGLNHFTQTNQYTGYLAIFPIYQNCLHLSALPLLVLNSPQSYSYDCPASPGLCSHIISSKKPSSNAFPSTISLLWSIYS